MKVLDIAAVTDNLPEVLDFINEELEQAGCSIKEQMQIDVACEEIFVNIASYAYNGGEGQARICIESEGCPPVFTFTFMDSGIPFNPLERDDPDVTLPAQERDIGGLGIYLTRTIMDEIAYEYTDGQNILTLRKQMHHSNAALKSLIPDITEPEE